MVAPQPNWSSHFSALQQQLHQLITQISSLRQPYENSLSALRGDLSQLGQTLNDAMPRHAIETLESEVRALGERVENMRHNPARDAALGAMRQELAEIRTLLPRFDVAQGFGHVSDALRDLHYKVDQVAAVNQASRIDPTAFKHLEQAVTALRGSNLASDVALGQIAAEVRALGLSFDRLSAESGAAAFGRLEARIASLIETGLAAQPAVDGSIRELGERLEQMQLTYGERLDQLQLSHGERHALGALEDRIAGLSEKLDKSDSRLGQLEAIERGVADLLVHLEEMRNGKGRALRAAPPTEAASEPPAPPPPAPTAVPPQPAPALSALDLLLPEMPMSGPAQQTAEASPPPRPQQQLQPLAPRAAPVEVESVARPEPARPPAARTMPRGPQRQPIDPNLPPDTPLEPGSGAPRIKPGSAAARIAASEAALGNSRPAAIETGGKSAAIAAARNAARAAYVDTPVKVSKQPDGKPLKWLMWPFKKAAKELPPSPQVQTPTPPPTLPPIPPAAPPAASMASTLPRPAPVDDTADAAPSSRAKVLKIAKTILIAASVAIIIAGVAQVGMEYLFPDQSPKPTTLPPKDQSQSLVVPSMPSLATAPNWPALTPAPAPATAPAATPEEPQPAAPAAADADSTNSIGRSSSIFDPATAVKVPDVTGSISPSASSSRAPAPSSLPAAQSNLDALPASISPALRTALASNEPAAQYEMGVRYADGRGVPQSLPDAIRWFKMASDAGFTPAQFRLGSLNEKGEGVRKDVKTAQRLYLAAAAKGHAKAMHNLAVLYAEGIDGRPDYKAASEWFRKAAGYGVTDSQYNLAILFARGIGVQTNLVESYKWFALAAANGDSDAAKKRDEVGARLDPTTLTTAKLAVQAFIPEREPDEATNLRTPPGGWDHAAAVPAKPRRRS
jgi:localization factor PodJL